LHKKRNYDVKSAICAAQSAHPDPLLKGNRKRLKKMGIGVWWKINIIIFAVHFKKT